MSHSDRKRGVLTEGLAPSRRMRICDVGANPLSTPPYQGLLDDGMAEVFGFEPNQEAFAKLEKAKGAAETYFPYAIGRPGKRRLYLHPWSGFTSLYPMDVEALRRIGKGFWYRPGKTKQIEVETVTLDRVPGLPQVDLLKMDLQGAEAEVLEGGQTVLQNALAVVTEVRFSRIYKDEPMFGDLDTMLRARGFRLHKFLFTKSVMMPHAHEDKIVRARMTSQLLDGDAVYIRDIDPNEEMSDDQVAHLALMADAVFASPDLALMCLDILIARGLADPGLPDAYIARLRTHQRAKSSEAAE